MRRAFGGGPVLASNAHATRAAPSIACGRRGDLTPEAHAEFVDAIYAAATDPDGWSDVFAKVRRHMGGHGTIYDRCVADPRSHRLALASLDPEFIDLYNGYYNATNLWATSPKAGDRPLYVTEEVVDGAALERTEFFADWLRPQGLKHGLSCRVGGAGGRFLHLGLVREAKYGAYDQGEVRFLEALTPHLRRAIEISHRLGEAEAQADAALDVLGRRGVATVLVDARGVVHAANAAADDVMRDGAGLTVRAGRLTAGTASGDAVLRRLIAAATGEGRSDAGRTGDLAVLGRDPRTALSVAAVPLPDRRRPFDLAHGPLAVLTFHRPSVPVAPSPETLRLRYALTPSEARLAVALCGGASLAGYAGDSGVSNTTVKTHLRQLFAKIGENRQVDLVRRLMSEAVAEAA